MPDSIFLALLLISNGIWRIHGVSEKTPRAGLFSDRQSMMGIGYILAWVALIFDSRLLFHARHDWQLVTMLPITLVAIVFMVSSKLFWHEPRQPTSMQN